MVVEASPDHGLFFFGTAQILLSSAMHLNARLSAREGPKAAGCARGKAASRARRPPYPSPPSLTAVPALSRRAPCSQTLRLCAPRARGTHHQLLQPQRARAPPAAPRARGEGVLGRRVARAHALSGPHVVRADREARGAPQHWDTAWDNRIVENRTHARTEDSVCALSKMCPGRSWRAAIWLP